MIEIRTLETVEQIYELLEEQSRKSWRYCYFDFMDDKVIFKITEPEQETAYVFSKENYIVASLKQYGEKQDISCVKICFKG